MFPELSFGSGLSLLACSVMVVVVVVVLEVLCPQAEANKMAAKKVTACFILRVLIICLILVPQVA